MRSRSLPAILPTFLLALAATPALAQNWPSQPIRFIVPYAAGGAADAVARPITQALAVALGTPVLLENRVGANTIVGAEVTAKSAPDGYTVLLGGSSTLALNPAGYKSLPYNVQRDFVSIAKTVSNYHLIVARKEFGPSTMAATMALAKTKPDAVTYASTGVGSPTHFAGLLMEMMGGVKMLHVPYKGIALVVNDLLGGQVDISASAPSAVLPHIKSGKLKVLAATSEKRLPSAPDVPTMWEMGYTGFTSGAWYVVVARAGTPPAIVNRLNVEINKALQVPATRTLLEANDFAIDGDLTPAQSAKFVADETVKWAKIVKDAKISFD